MSDHELLRELVDFLKRNKLQFHDLNSKILSKVTFDGIKEFRTYQIRNPNSILINVTFYNDTQLRLNFGLSQILTATSSGSAKWETMFSYNGEHFSSERLEEYEKGFEPFSLEILESGALTKGAR